MPCDKGNIWILILKIRECRCKCNQMDSHKRKFSGFLSPQSKQALDTFPKVYLYCAIIV